VKKWREKKKNEDGRKAKDRETVSWYATPKPFILYTFLPLNFLLTSFRSYSSAPSLYVDILCRCPLNVLKRQIKNSKYPGKQRLIALAAMITRYRSCSSLRLYSAFPSFFFYCNRLPVPFGLTWYHWTLGPETTLSRYLLGAAEWCTNHEITATWVAWRSRRRHLSTTTDDSTSAVADHRISG